MTQSVLSQICAKKAEHLSAMRAATPLAALQDTIAQAEPPRGFIRALRNATTPGPALITEIKKASPSKGIIRADFDPVEIARIYQDSGAACLSVLTDEPYFQGRDEYLVAVKNAVKLPALRKDFMINPYQIYESRALGADCILLIMACLSDTQASEMHDLAKTLGMDVLVEIHDAKELERATRLKPEMIGINNRNLKTLEVDVQTSFDLAPAMPANCLRVSESGLSDPATIQKLSKAGFSAFLVGESLMRQPDIAAAVRSLRAIPD